MRITFSSSLVALVCLAQASEALIGRCSPDLDGKENICSVQIKSGGTRERVHIECKEGQTCYKADDKTVKSAERECHWEQAWGRVGKVAECGGGPGAYARVNTNIHLTAKAKQEQEQRQSQGQGEGGPSGAQQQQGEASGTQGEASGAHQGQGQGQGQQEHKDDNQLPPIMLPQGHLPPMQRIPPMELNPVVGPQNPLNH